MALKAQWEADVKQAMLQKNEVVRDTLRLVLAELKKLNMEKGVEITPEVEQDVLLKAVKQRQQSIDEFTKAARPDLADKEKAELAVLQSYLPKQLGEAEAKAAIVALAKELNVTAKKDQGTVMKAVMARYKGQLDGKTAQKILGEILT
jgi:uncharacterized protein